jgi:hypothetical protein
MRLSTFSFDFTDLFRAAAAAICVVLAAWILLPRQPPYENQLPFSAEVGNELVVAQYVEHYRDKPVVIVGSSITTMIPVPDCRPRNVASIPLQGRSAVTGLEIIRQIGARPDIVFVEVPQLGLGVDRELIGTVLTPIYWRIRAFLSPLRFTRNWLIRLYQKRQWDLRPFNYTVEFPRETVGAWDQQHVAGFNEILRTLGTPRQSRRSKPSCTSCRREARA